MNTLVEVAIPAAEFALEETFDTIPEARFELLSTVAHHPETGPPLLRVQSDQPVAEALRTDRTIESVETIASKGNSTLFSVEWGVAMRTVFETMLADDVVISTVHGTDRQWMFRLRTTSRDAASEMYHRCDDRGISMEIRRFTELDGVSDGHVDFSPEQWEVLQLAFEHGYYDIPRGITVGDLAEELGVSHQAVSERLRRAHDQLIGNSIRR